MADASKAGLTDSIIIDASVNAIMETLLDFESYPDWMSGVVEVEVIKRDKKKRGTQVRYVVDAILTKVNYTLDYTYKEKENKIETAYVEGDLDDCSSWYKLEALDDDRTEVTYHYEVAYSIPRALLNPLTKRLLKSVDKRVMNSSLNDLKKRCVLES